MIQYPLYIKSLLVVCFFVVYGTRVQAQKPKNGIYTYKIAFAEWNGRALGSSCIVRIKRDSVILINNGTLSGEKGDIIDKGIIVKHVKTGKWVIAHSNKDKYAKEVGGCSDGPIVIDFKQKKVWLC